MDYNTTRKRLVLPEYGRGVQQMVDYMLTVADRDERSRMARSVVAIMGSMNPQIREQSDYKHKLWDHLFIMSDFKLDIDAPYPMPSRESYSYEPEKLPYSNKKPIKQRHYGRIIEDMVRVAVEMTDENIRDEFKLLIANQMKRTHLAWNKDSVADEEIFSDLYAMSNGKLKMTVETKLLEARDLKLGAQPNSNLNSNGSGGKKRKKRRKK